MYMSYGTVALKQKGEDNHEQEQSVQELAYAKDSCRLQALSLQRNLNMLRKFALSMIKQYKVATSSRKALSQIMFDCLLDCNKLLSITQN